MQFPFIKVSSSAIDQYVSVSDYLANGTFEGIKNLSICFCADNNSFYYWYENEWYPMGTEPSGGGGETH